MQYEQWSSFYDRTVQASSDNITEAMRDAILLQHLRQLKEKNVKATLEYFDKNIVQKIGVAYNITSKFSEYENNAFIKNPFEQIIIDLRELAENKFDEKEVSELDNNFVLWYDSNELDLIRENRKNTNNNDGELGGHLMQKKVSNDMSYLITNDEAERLFQETVLGVVSSAQ